MPKRNSPENKPAIGTTGNPCPIGLKIMPKAPNPMTTMHKRTPRYPKPRTQTMQQMPKPRMSMKLRNTSRNQAPNRPLGKI